MKIFIEIATAASISANKATQSDSLPFRCAPGQAAA